SNMAFSIDKRNKQRIAGEHELDCLEFLKSCLDGTYSVVSQLVIRKNIYVDVMDADGNTGLLLASINQHKTVMSFLFDVGADVNHVNDECLNALHICILQYISGSNEIDNWEQAFLYNKPQNQEKNWPKYWDPLKSFFLREEADDAYVANINLSRQLFRKISGIHSTTSFQKQKHDVNEACVSPDQDILQYPAKISVIVFQEPELRPELVDMGETVQMLLEHGANPNSCEVPYFTLMLAVYSRNTQFVELLLKHGANPNASTEPADGGMTALHAVAMLPASEITLAMCKILLENGADPNIKTKAENEREIMEKAFGSNILEYDNEEEIKNGRTTLHCLCIRPDIKENKKILRTMCTLILQRSPANPNILHMGHTPLALAIRKGDVDLVTQFLSSGMVDPNHKLGPGLGVPLTFVFSNNCSSLDSNIKMEMINLLVEYGANPLKKVMEADFTGNSIEYIYNILGYNDEKNGKQNKNIKGKRKLTTKNKEIKPVNKNKKDKSGKKLKGKQNNEPIIGTEDLVNKLKDHMRQRILRFIQGFIIHELLRLETYSTPDISILPENIKKFIDMAANMLNPEDVLRCMWIIREFKHNYMTDNQALEILDLIVKFHGIQTEDYRQKYKDMISGQTKFWISLKEQEQKEKQNDPEEKEEKVEDKLQLFHKKRKKNSKLLNLTTPKIKEKIELEIEHYQWGISEGKYINEEKASADNIIKDLNSSLQCLSTFVNSVCLSEINIVFSLYVAIPELDTNQEETYRVCFECGRAQGIHLESCSNCELILFCSEHINDINILHNCNTISPWINKEREVQEYVKSDINIQQNGEYDKTTISLPMSEDITVEQEHVLVAEPEIISQESINDWKIKAVEKMKQMQKENTISEEAEETEEFVSIVESVSSDEPISEEPLQHTADEIKTKTITSETESKGKLVTDKQKKKDKIMRKESSKIERELMKDEEEKIKEVKENYKKG
ncbi:hypothetical protein L9F63_001276, partial [Diploptera punctata]